MGIARLMAPAVVSAFIVSVFCSACVRQPYDRGGRYSTNPEGEYFGEQEILITNKTPTPITKVHIADSFTGYPKVVYFDRKYGKLDAIMPNTAQALHVKAAKYWISVDNINYQRVVEKKEVPVTTKTNLVIYAGGDPPEPMPGYETVSVAAGGSGGGGPPPVAQGGGGGPPRDREREQRDKNLRANKAECTRDIPPPNLTPQPGRIKIGGSWRCVMSGELSGFDAIDIAQLPDGRIDAFVTAGYDKNHPVKGAVVGDELHFYFPKFSAAGGRMKIDGSQRSMSGDGASFQDDGRCTHWRFSCTKQ